MVDKEGGVGKRCAEGSDGSCNALLILDNGLKTVENAFDSPGEIWHRKLCHRYLLNQSGIDLEMTYDLIHN